MALMACLILVMLSAVTVQGSVPARADDDDTPSSWSIPNYGPEGTGRQER